MKEFIDKLIERLEEKEQILLDNAGDIGCTIGIVNAMECSKEIVNELAEEYKGDWIPCSERLPKQNEEVLATILLKGKPMVLIINYDHTWLDDGLSKLIAWMPLPAPYTEGE